MEADELDFLQQSNWIEGEYGSQELDDAVEAWKYAKQHIHNITIEVILEIHRLLLQRRDPLIAGKIRDYTVYIAKEIKDQKPEKIKSQLQFLCDMNIEFMGMFDTNIEEEIICWHVSFESVHPFGDGNGRVGRILLNMQRLAMNLPILVIWEEERQNYYKWFSNPRYVIPELENL